MDSWVIGYVLFYDLSLLQFYYWTCDDIDYDHDGLFGV